MIKTVFILIFLFVFSVLATAQITIKPGGGFLYSNYNREITGWDRIGGIGYQAGGTVTVGNLIYGEAGVFWTQSKSEFSRIADSTGNGVGPVRFNHTLSMLRVPVLAGYAFWDTQGKMLDFRVFMGPVFNIVLQADNSLPHPDAPVKSDYKSLSWGGSVGVSLTYWWLFADVGYELGFSRIYKDSNKFGATKVSRFYINLGIMLRL